MGNTQAIPKRILTEDERKALVIVQKEIVKGIFFARKKKLKYRIIDFLKIPPQLQKTIIESMREGITKGGIYDSRIFPKLSVLINLPTSMYPPLSFSTFYKAGILSSQEFEEKNVKVGQNSVLIKGPLEEIYQVGNIDGKYDKISNSVSSAFVPKQDVHKFIKITPTIFDLMKKSKRFVEVNKKTLEIEVSYDGTHNIPITHNVQVGDVIVVDEDIFYRIKKDVFDATYEIVTPVNVKR